jgi:hypothetical protein
MNEQLIRAGFLRRLGAVVVDAIVIFVLTTAVFWIWATRELGALPQTPAELGWLVDAGQVVAPAFLLATGIVYMVACWTPLLGRRSIGMRQFGIIVARETR